MEKEGGRTDTQWEMPDMLARFDMSASRMATSQHKDQRMLRSLKTIVHNGER